MDNGKYDKRNKLNDLTGKEWLKLTNSFWVSEKSADDKFAMQHPAPYLIKDTEKLISMFTKRGARVLDPFIGSGTTIIAADNIGRSGYGIDLSEDYINLCKQRLASKKISLSKHALICGDSCEKMDEFEDEFFDYMVTSPPYHNILKNTASGLRSDNSKKGFRNGARQGIEYYSDNPNDLGSQKTFEDFKLLLKKIMAKAYRTLRSEKYCTIVISDFTVDKKEVCVQAHIVELMTGVGFEFVGTTVLLQPNKPLYPFGYPFAYKINHHHQNLITFRKPKEN